MTPTFSVNLLSFFFGRFSSKSLASEGLLTYNKGHTYVLVVIFVRLDFMADLFLLCFCISSYICVCICTLVSIRIFKNAQANLSEKSIRLYILISY